MQTVEDLCLCLDVLSAEIYLRTLEQLENVL